VHEPLAVVGLHIRLTRQARGMEQQELADAMGVSQGAVSNWERGKRALSVPDFMRICRVLNVPPKALLPDGPPADAAAAPAVAVPVAAVLRVCAPTEAPVVAVYSNPDDAYHAADTHNLAHGTHRGTPGWQYVQPVDLVQVVAPGPELIQHNNSQREAPPWKRPETTPGPRSARKLPEWCGTAAPTTAATGWRAPSTCAM